MNKDIELLLITIFLKNNNLPLLAFKTKNELSKFINLNFENVINDKLYNIYNDILDIYYFQSERLFKDIVNELYFKYYLYTKEKIDSPVYLFLDSNIFGFELIKNYFKNSFDLTTKIMENKDDLYYQKNILPLRWKIYGLSDLLRKKLSNLFLEYTLFQSDYQYNIERLYKDIKNNKESEDINFINNYFPYFIRLMYTDLCEIFYLDKNNDEDSNKAYLYTKNLLLNFDNLKDITFLYDKDVFNIYISVINDVKKRKDARKNLSKELKLIIKKNNPLYLLDEF